MTRWVKLKDWTRRAPDVSKRIAQRKGKKPRVVSRAKARHVNLQILQELERRGIVAK